MGTLSLLVVAVLAQTAQVKGLPVKIAPYDGWQDAYHFSNGTVEVVVVPKIGRIMRFAYVGGPNILWHRASESGKEPDPQSKEWQNYGGDKLWVAPEDLWGWPPPFALDSGPYVGTPIENGIKLVGPTDKKFGIHMEREITLGKHGSDLRVLNRMVNDTKAKVYRSIWQITQVESPDFVSVALNISKAWPAGYYDYKSADLGAPYRIVKDGQLILRRSETESRKYGTAAKNGTLFCKIGDQTLTVSTKYEPKATYADTGSAQQVYVNQAPDRYAELELVSPMVWLKPGESREMTVKLVLGKSAS